MSHASSERLGLSSGSGRVGPVSWQSLALELHPGDLPDEFGWQASIGQLLFAGQAGDLSLECRFGGLRAGRPWCKDGVFDWQFTGSDRSLSGQIYDPSEGDAIGVRLIDGQVDLRLNWPQADQALSAELRLAEFSLAELPREVVEMTGLSLLEGQLRGVLHWTGEDLAGRLEIAGLDFDRPDGLVAGAGLAADIDVEAQPLPGAAGWSFAVALGQHAGELLAGPVYLPPPDEPLTLSMHGRYRPEDGVEVTSLELDDGELLELSGAFGLGLDEQGWSLRSLSIDRAVMQLPQAWARWGEGVASGFGLAGLTTAGRIEAQLRWQEGQIESLQIDLDDLALDDARQRFAIAGLSGRLERDSRSTAIALDWSALELFSLEFGSSRLRAGGEEQNWALSEALRLPLLDGGVVIERLDVEERPGAVPELDFDARIEPLKLARLTRMLGLPEFGGELSGEFPGVLLDGDRLAFAGGIEIAAFSGRISLAELVIERPFGSLPALAAQVEIERLDLAELTGAFNFGHMEGHLSGWVRDLRLLDWQPVAMDARVFTHEDSPRRRISQRAVENLSNLGGGAAALSAPFLGLFEEFPYRRAGLACRLDRNICHIDGVAPHDSGGFYIVQGRLLPRLDVIGHRRLVDWPRLVAQLAAISEE